MDWALLVELVKAVAWPLVAAYGIYKAGRFIKDALPRLLRLKWGDKEIELGEVPQLPQPEAAEATKGLPSGSEPKQLPAGTGSTGTSSPPNPNETTLPAPAQPELVAFAPAGAVINTWSRLVDTMDTAARRLGIIASKSPARPPSASSLISIMVRAELLDEAAADVAQRLSTIRHRTAHTGDVPTHEAAARYVETVDELIRVIRARVDQVRLRDLLASLRATKASEVDVAPLSAFGIGATEEVAHEMASGRRGMWGASRGGVKVMISEEDAALLILAGARRSDRSDM